MSFNRLFVDDEELGKKDDDFRPDGRSHIDDTRHPSSSSSSSSSIGSWLASPRMRRRRIALLAGLLIFAYVFVKNIPTDLKPVGTMVDVRDPSRTIRGVTVVNQRPIQEAPPAVSQPAKEPPKSTTAKEAPTRKAKAELPKTTLKSEDVPAVLRGGEKTSDHYYDGPLKFFELPASLYGITHTQGHRDDNKNVVFVAATTKSASRLIPLACEMANFKRNHVHFAFFGRDAIDIDTLKELNGAARECSIYWHDARPDESDISTDGRMEYAVNSALHHVTTYMHPQVYLSDDLEQEPRWFTKALQGHTSRVGRSLIDIPTDAVEKLMWLTRLDHASLAAWETVYIDILIHVPPSGSGSLMRLLKTIESADYFGSRHPHITIELPPKVETSTQLFLDNFVWPPLSQGGGKHVSQITLRRRISREHLTPMESSIRTVESFYSARPHQSHVLVLSTQTELSPLYYHYLFYHTLEYGYSSYFKGTPEQEALLGIALDLPGSKMNGEDKFEPPTGSDGSKATPFYWQAPDTHAALYFGNKWLEFHNFVSRRLSSSASQKQKIVSPKFPAFAEPLLELMRARCWFMLYPNLYSDDAIATVHNELSAPPEEYQPPKPKSKSSETEIPLAVSTNAPYLEPVDVPSALPDRVEKPLIRTQLVNILPDDGDLPDLNTLPIMTWDSKVVPLSGAISAAAEFATEFYKKIAGCTGKYSGVRFINTVDDLFCDEPNPAEPKEPEHAPSSTPDPVHAGLAAAIVAQDTDVPDAVKKEPKQTVEKPKETSKVSIPGDESDLDFDRLSKSGLELDTTAPPKPVSGDSAVRKDSAGDSTSDAKPDVKGIAHTQTPHTGSSAEITNDQEQAMKKEYQAHLERLGKDPIKMQNQVEDKLKKDSAAGKDKTEVLKGGL